MAEHEVLMGVAIDHRRRQIEVTTMQRGKSRHTHYPALRLAPAEMRGEALGLIRTALHEAGYSSLAELDAALTSEIVVPEPKADDAPPKQAAPVADARAKPGRGTGAKKKALEALLDDPAAGSAKSPSRRKR